MTRNLMAIAILIALAGAAHAFGFGLGDRLGKLGSISKGAGTPVPPTTCTSTGIFDLSNTCNDIYFIGALK